MNIEDYIEIVQELPEDDRERVDPNWAIPPVPDSSASTWETVIEEAATAVIEETATAVIQETIVAGGGEEDARGRGGDAGLTDGAYAAIGVGVVGVFAVIAFVYRLISLASQGVDVGVMMADGAWRVFGAVRRWLDFFRRRGRGNGRGVLALPAP